MVLLPDLKVAFLNKTFERGVSYLLEYASFYSRPGGRAIKEYPSPFFVLLLHVTTLHFVGPIRLSLIHINVLT